MTWFLNDVPKAVPQPTTPDLPLTNFSAGVGAAFSNIYRAQAGEMMRRGEVMAETESLMQPTIDKLGVDRAKEILRENGFVDTQSPYMLATTNQQARDLLLAEARIQADANPAEWKDFGNRLSAGSIESRVTEKRKKEDSDAQRILAMSPRPGLAEFIGGLGAGMADWKQWPLLAINPGGSLLRTMAWQAGLGATGAAINLPNEQAVAKELDNPAPDALGELAMGALAGAALEGVVRGIPMGLSSLGRALEYHKTRTDPVMGDHLADAVGAGMEAGKTPVEAATAALQAEPPLPPREPLFLDGSMRVQTPEPTALAPDPITTSEIPPAPGEAPQSTGQLEAMLNDAIPETAKPADAVIKGPKVKKPVDLSTFVVKNGGIWKGSDRGDLAALEYRRPGFLKNNKLQETAGGNNGGGHDIDMMREKAAQAGYLPMDSSINDFLDLLRADTRGTKAYAQSDLAQALEAQGQKADAGRNPDAPQEPIPEPSNTGWVVDLANRDYDGAMQDLERSLNNYLDEQWPDLELTASEREQFVSHMTTYGGDAQDVVYRIASREREFVEAEGPASHADLTDPAYKDWLDSLMGQGNDPNSGGGAVRPIKDAGPEGNGAAAQGNAFDVESTAIGDQYIVPGTNRAQVANRDKDVIALKQRQSKMRRPDQVRVEDDAGGLFSAPNLDFFDDMDGPAAKAYIDQVAADFEQVADQGFGVDVPPGLVTDEGQQLVTTQDVLDEFKAMDDMEREYAACMRAGVEDGA